MLDWRLLNGCTPTASRSWRMTSSTSVSFALLEPSSCCHSPRGASTPQTQHLSLLNTSRDLLRCELALLASVNIRNCISFYQTAEEIGAETLKEHCSTMITNYWVKTVETTLCSLLNMLQYVLVIFLRQDDFTSADFEAMSAPLAFKMFKTKSKFPLHKAIATNREDVVFLFLVENDSQVDRETEKQM